MFAHRLKGPKALSTHDLGPAVTVAWWRGRNWTQTVPLIYTIGIGVRVVVVTTNCVIVGRSSADVRVVSDVHPVPAVSVIRPGEVKRGISDWQAVVAIIDVRPHGTSRLQCRVYYRRSYV